MSGKILLDTNAIIYALNDGLKLPKARYAISIITEMELFSYPKLTKDEETNITNLLKNFEIFALSDEIKKMTIQIRKSHGLKLPDGIICATTLVHGMTLISNDKQLAKVTDLKMLSLEEFSSK